MTLPTPCLAKPLNEPKIEDVFFYTRRVWEKILVIPAADQAAQSIP